MEEKTTRLAALIAYDGSSYCGWQVQDPNDTPTPSIQGTLQEAAKALCGQDLFFQASGRTDAGVHAIGQVAHFDLPKTFSERVTPYKLPLALNAKLPPSIRILKTVSVPSTFHALRDARSKRYRYRILIGPSALPTERYTSWNIFHKLDLNKLNASLDQLTGTHDFKCFESVGVDLEDTVRTLTKCSVRSCPTDLPAEYQLLEFHFEGDGFLKQMVRNMVGTLVSIGRETLPADYIPTLIASKDRKKAGPAAPAHGLCLEKVTYADELF